MKSTLQLAPQTDNGRDQVLCKVLTPLICLLAWAFFPLPPKPSPIQSRAILQSFCALPQERQLETRPGKSPLRLISDRKLLDKGIWLETLECGHKVHTFQDFLWDDKGHLILLEPKAKRRRCGECKALAVVIPFPKRSHQSSPKKFKQERAA